MPWGNIFYWMMSSCYAVIPSEYRSCVLVLDFTRDHNVRIATEYVTCAVGHIQLLDGNAFHMCKSASHI